MKIVAGRSYITGAGYRSAAFGAQKMVLMIEMFVDLKIDPGVDSLAALVALYSRRSHRGRQHRRDYGNRNK